MRLLPLLVVAVLAAGCGGRSGRYGPPPTSPEATYIRQCGACHTLAAAGTHGTAGPNLDDAKPTANAVLRAIVRGPGAMPADLLQGDEARLVSLYVARNAG